MILAFLVALQSTPIVFVTNEPQNVPKSLLTPQTMQEIDGGVERLDNAKPPFTVYRGKSALLVVNPQTLCVKQILELTTLARAVSKAPRRGLVTGLGAEAIAVLERRLPENLPENVWPGDKLDPNLRYEVGYNIDLVLTTDENSIRYSLSPDEGEASREFEGFRSNAISYKGRQDASLPPRLGELLSASYVVLRSSESNPGAFAELVAHAASDFQEYMKGLESAYSDELYHALAPYSGILDRVAPKGRGTKRLSDLSEEQAAFVGEGLSQQWRQRGFQSEAALDRFLQLASVSVRPSITLVLPVKQRDGRVIRFGYNLALPKDK